MACSVRGGRSSLENRGSERCAYLRASADPNCPTLRAVDRGVLPALFADQSRDPAKRGLGIAAWRLEDRNGDGYSDLRLSYRPAANPVDYPRSPTMVSVREIWLFSLAKQAWVHSPMSNPLRDDRNLVR